MSLNLSTLCPGVIQLLSNRNLVSLNNNEILLKTYTLFVLFQIMIIFCVDKHASYTIFLIYTIFDFHLNSFLFIRTFSQLKILYIKVVCVCQVLYIYIYLFIYLFIVVVDVAPPFIDDLYIKFSFKVFKGILL